MANKNGHDDDNVTRFPDSRERAELERRQKAANDKTPKAPYEPVFNLPPVVQALCIALIVVQVIVACVPDETVEIIFNNFAFYVLRYTGGMPFGWQGLVSPVTHMFLHGGWLHLGINVATLAAFGAGLEKDLGGKKLLVMFLATGIAGAFTHAGLYVVYGASGNAALFPSPEAPMVGASGGISGLFGAVLMMAQAQGLMGSQRRLLAFVGLWIGISLFFGYFGMPGQSGPIAWTTHVGGFIAGLLLYRPLARSKIF